jgi:hypothetical protein
MNCPTCGAENEADARFCAECGAPLESQTDEMMEEDDDRTIMSTVSQISEEAKTVSVTQEDVANLAAEIEAEDAELEPETEAESPPPTPPVEGAGEDNTRRYIIIGVVVLLVLCCCCLLVGIIVATSSESINNILESSFMRDMSPTLLAFI